MLHKAFIVRQILRPRKQMLLFAVCITLSMVTLASVNGFSERVDDAMQADARRLHGGDVIVRSRFPLSPALTAAAGALAEQDGARISRLWEFYSVVQATASEATLLSSVKIVDKAYPLYGNVELASGRKLEDVLVGGAAVVEKNLLDRLGVRVGDRIQVGRRVLTVADVVVGEPDRPVNPFQFGPRVLISEKDKDSLGLVQKGSRIRYKLYVQTPPSLKPEDAAKRLRAAAMKDQERVDTFRTARSRLKRFLDNFFFFLRIVGVFTLVLAGVGISSSVTAYLREERQTAAIFKTLGARSRVVVLQYMAVLLVFSLAGAAVGVLMSLVIQWFLPTLFAGILPAPAGPPISWRSLLEGFGLGICAAALFAFAPLFRLKDVKPSAVFRHETGSRGVNVPAVASALAAAALFAAVILLKMEDLRNGLRFLAGIGAVLLLSGILTAVALRLLRRVRPRRLSIRQALRGLFRPGNATAPIVLTLTASLTVLFSIYLLEQNLNAAFVRSYPPDMPNLFFLDIQPDQRGAFTRELGRASIFYPIVRARILAVNGKPVDRDREQRRRGDNLARTFNLTYRHHLLEDEELTAGNSLFPDGTEGVSVSILDTVAEIPEPHLKVGDRIAFRIQGVPLDATVSSIRTRKRESISPFFYFVFPDRVLKDAPQTIFTAVRVEKEQIAGIQNRIVSAFPNVTVVDVTHTAEVVSAVLRKLSKIVRFFMLFSIGAGMLIVISSIFATRFARVQEAVYYKILGARGRFVWEVFTLENAWIGMISGLSALALAQTGSWLIATRLFHVAYRPFAAASSVMVVSTCAAVILTGLAASRSIVRKKPARFLQEQTRE